MSPPYELDIRYQEIAPYKNGDSITKVSRTGIHKEIYLFCDTGIACNINAEGDTLNHTNRKNRRNLEKYETFCHCNLEFSSFL